jgi:hypothetical protein
MTYEQALLMVSGTHSVRKIEGKPKIKKFEKYNGRK